MDTDVATDVTGRAIIALALAATACLVLGSRLIDQSSAGSQGLAFIVLGVGTALAASAVAGAWRPRSAPPATREDGAD